jgi:gallate decarboxylase subunit D
MTLIELSAERGRVRLHLRCLRLGEDLCVTLSGGDREHIGAVALSQPRISHEEPGKTSTTTSVLALQGHREDELARRIASHLASRLGATVCVACGIHVDAIQPRELSDVQELSEELTKALLERLASPELDRAEKRNGDSGDVRG